MGNQCNGKDKTPTLQLILSVVAFKLKLYHKYLSQNHSRLWARTNQTRKHTLTNQMLALLKDQKDSILVFNNVCLY